ncbi:MAG TPA: RNA 3'-terminal phosphate cyclase, partial [Gammaproteobacteria bacterium]|nr:RNA 3'-terminal phosphate cyclase [Gammaproteobacteria bacterium]
DDLFDFLASGAALDRYIVDQLLLPLALAQGESALSTARISPHLLTNCAVIQAFLPVAIDIDGEPGSPGVVRVRPTRGQQLPLPLPEAAARPQPAVDWNVVVSVRGQHFNQVRRLLTRLGRVRRTPFFNVLTLAVEDQHEFLEALAGELALAPALREGLGHVTPVSTTFAFEAVADFETKVQETALALLPALAGKRFHVRLHRRGFKGRLDSQVEERQLAGPLLTALQKRGTPAQVDFDDPDAILIVEIVGQRAGLAVWNREDFARYPFIQPN